MPVSKGSRGRGRPRGSKSASTQTGNMKKTTPAGAYAPAKKTAFAIRRKPFVETKQREDYVIQHLNNPQDVADPPTTPGLDPYFFTADRFRTIPLDNAITTVRLDSFNRMVQGLKDYEMIGDAIFSKSINLKLQFRFPQRDAIINMPYKLYVVTGWVTAPCSFTTRTTPTATDATQLDLHQYVDNQVAEYFDQRVDEMRWQTREYNNIKIESYRRVKPKLDSALAPPAAAAVTPTGYNAGTVPDVKMNFHWKTNRKIHYTLGTETNNASGSAVDIQNYYPNQQWLPFCVIYNPEFQAMEDDHGGTGDQGDIQIHSNSIHHYTDS